MKPFSRFLKHLFIPHRGNAYRPHAFRHKALSAYSVGLILSQLFFGVAMYSGPVINAADAETIGKNIITLVNEERSDSGAGILYENLSLKQAASLKLSDMFAKGYWDHTGPNGETAWDFIDDSGYRYTLAGENLARGFTSSNEAVAAWMKSPTHKGNILNSRFREIGIAVGSGKIKGEATTVIVQLFGEPKTAFAESTSKKEIAGSQKLIPEFSLKNTTVPSKAPYFVLWTFIFALIVVDGVMIRRLNLHTSKAHVFNFRAALLMSLFTIALLGIGVAAVA